MKISFKAAHAAAVVAVVRGAVSPRSPIPALQHLRITADAQGVRVAATDLTLFIECEMPADVLTPGTALVSASVFSGLLARSPDDSMTLETTKSGGTLRAGKRGRWQVPELNEELPGQDRIKGEALTMKTQDLVSAIQGVKGAVAVKDVRTYLCSVCLDMQPKAFYAVATDGHRAHRVRISDAVGDQSWQALVPTAALQPLLAAFKRCGETVTLRRDFGALQVQGGGLVFTTKLVEGRFPDYERIMPTFDGYGTAFTLDVEPLAGALQRAITMQAEMPTGHHSVYLRAVDGQFTVSNERAGHESDDAVMDCDEPWLEWKGRPDYLLEGIRAVGGPRVELASKGREHALMMRPAGGSEEDAQVVIMGMR